MGVQEESAENLQIPERPQISDEGSNNLRNSESADSGTTHRLVTRAGPKICRFLSSGLLAVGRQTAKKSADSGPGICRLRDRNLQIQNSAPNR